jgi:ABC-2 type transport system permease protein
MHSVLIMAAKDLKLISRDRVGMFFIIGFPVLMGLLSGVISGSFDTKSGSLSIAVVDEDESEMSAKFVEALNEAGNVKIERLGRQDAMDRVRRGRLVGMIAIPEGFGETAGIMWMEGPAIELGVDPSRRAESGMLQGLIMQAAGKLTAARFQDPSSMRPFIKQAQDEFATSDDIPILMRPLLTEMMGSLDNFTQSLERVQAAHGDDDSNGAIQPSDMLIARIETIDVTRELPKDSPAALVRKLQSKWDIGFPQAMLWGVLACAAGFAVTIVRERKQGTLLRLQVAPVTRAQILAGKAAACFLSVIAVIVFLVVLGMWLGMRPRSAGLLTVAALCVAFCFVGVMMLMSVIGKTEEAVSGAAWGGNVLMAMFGGAMLPLAFMPSFMRTISHFSPVKWGILALEGAIWRGFTLTEMLGPCAVLIGIGVAGMTIGTIVLSRATN